jgi:hypothetical protein
MIRICSMDVGYCNSAHYVEDFHSDDIDSIRKKYEKLPNIKKRRVKGGALNPEVENLIQETIMTGERVHTGVYTFVDNIGQGLDISTRIKLLNHFNEYTWLWDTCDIFIIEQQFFSTRIKGKKGTVEANINCLKIAEVLFMWFLERYPFKVIAYIGSQNKTQVLGAPWGMTKPQRKKWATQKALEIYIDREDQDMITLYDLAEAVKRKQIKTMERVLQFKSDYPCESEDADDLSTKIICEKQKLEDPADACCQCQAYKFRTFVACY